MNTEQKTFYTILFFGITTTFLTLFIIYYNGKKAFTLISKDSLTAIRTAKKLQIETYFNQIQNQCETFAQDFMIINAMKEFKEAFESLNNGTDNDQLNMQKKTLSNYYDNEFLARLNPHLSIKKNAEQFIPEKSASVLLQNVYIAENPNPIGQKDKLTDAPKAGSYNEVHAKYHPYLRNFLEKFKYYDIFLIDHVSGVILYTVFKEIDFANNLFTTELKKSNLAQLIKQISQAEKTLHATIIDYNFYDPSYAAPAAFIATPIYENDIQIGVLAFQMPSDQINLYMTDDKEWEKAGLGKTGEAYLIGNDFSMRSISRFLIQDRKNYLQQLKNEKTDSLIIKNIETFDTTILLQRVNTKSARKALKGKTGEIETKDYRGLKVLSAFAPLKIKGLNWAILVEKDKSEILSSLYRLMIIIGFWNILILLTLIFTAFLFTRYIFSTKKIKDSKPKH
ncbi:MAG: hypothetical protein WD055_05315 [Candidatus Dependentiae bacterium]